VQASEDSSSDGPSTLAQVVSKTKKHTKETAKPEKTKKKRKKVLSFLLQLLYCRSILPCLPLAIIVPWLDHALNGPRSVGLACSELKQQLLSLPVFNSRECHMLILLVTSVCLFHYLSVCLSVCPRLVVKSLTSPKSSEIWTQVQVALITRVWSLAAWTRNLYKR